MPSVDENSYFKTVIEFRSGTPSMTLWASTLSLTSDALVLESEIDGKTQPGTTIRRSGISRLTLDFLATFED